MNVLNPALYAALLSTFGRVTVSNRGVPMSAVYIPGSSGKALLQPSSPGEYYAISCPYCNDTGCHLYINHRWGEWDAKTHTRNLWLANCFLNECVKSWENLKDLAARVLRAGGQSHVPPVQINVEKPPALRPMRLPADTRLLTHLPKSHPANEYIRGREFDCGELVEWWDISFSFEAYPADHGRLLIPLRAFLIDDHDNAAATEDPDENREPVAADATDWHIVGYQARLITDGGDDRPKYLTSAGTPKSRLLYGLARVEPEILTPIIVCEGPTDVWRAGPGAVALLGKSISDAQCRLIRGEHPGRDVVVMLDPEAADEAAVVAERLRTVLARDLSGIEPGRVVVAQLPDDRDPGECTREEIWASARRAMAPRHAARRRNGKS